MEMSTVVVLLGNTMNPDSSNGPSWEEPDADKLIPTSGGLSSSMLAWPPGVCTAYTWMPKGADP
eukprot:1145333-Pelagomonas_calceolata.AAC.2